MRHFGRWLACLSFGLFWAGWVQADTSLASARLEKPQPHRPEIAVTIDFLDYVFYDKEGGDDYYPLEAYENRIRELVEVGTTKLYLRVNVCGLTLYPTQVAGMYGDEFGTHAHYISYGPQRLINTLERYDPLEETIRLGRKYGLEVWAWESLFDDAGVAIPIGNYFLMDPWFRENTHLYSMRAPWKQFPEEEIQRRNAESEGRVIGKIVVQSERATGPLRITKEHVRIYTSQDNTTYESWVGEFTFSSEREGNINRVILDDLAIDAKFVELRAIGLPTDDEFSVVWRSQRGVSKVYDLEGEEIPAVWGFNLNPRTRSSLRLRSEPIAWDYGHRSIGFGVGEPEQGVEHARYYLGLAEFVIPEVMAHKLARFEELLAYDFDGFMFNLRMHSTHPNPDEFGFNPEVRAVFFERFGQDIWQPGTYDVEELFKLRAAAIEDFYRECKQLAGERPLYVAALPRPDKGEKPNRWSHRLGRLGELMGTQRKWSDVDGVMMLDAYFADRLEQELTANQKIGRFIELRNMSDAALRASVEQVLSDPRVGEIEFYEALNITSSPTLMETMRQLLVEKAR